MSGLALPSVILAWCIQYFDSQFLLVVPAGLWAAAVLGAWLLLGVRPALLLLVAGWTLVRADWTFAQRLPAQLAGQDILVTGRVCDFARTDPDATRFVLIVEEPFPGGAAPGRVHLGWYRDAPEIAPGQRWQLKLRLRPPRGLVNAGTFDFEQWLYVRSIGASGYVRPSALNRSLPAGLQTCPVGGLRERLVRRVAGALGDHPAAGHVLGIVAGATHRIAGADWELLRQTGTTHLLAISGLNVAMVAAPGVLLWPWIARLLPCIAAWPLGGLLFGLVCATAYSALAGFAVSTLRAVIMLAAATALALRRRHVGVAELLAFAAISQLALDPAAVMAAGFGLSFLGVAWLLLLSGRREAGEAGPALAPVRAVLHAAASLGHAQIVLGLGLAPLTLAWFQEVSLIAPLTNLLAVPVFTLVVMPLALAGAALQALVPALAGALLLVAADSIGLLLSLLRWTADSVLAIWHPPAISWVGLMLAESAAVVLCWWRPLPWRACSLLLLLPLVCGERVLRPPLSVTVMDVGQGLSVLVQTARHTLLYDAGPAYRMRDAGESVVVPVMRASGIDQLDMLMLSHADQDHAGGAGSVLAAFPSALVVAPDPTAHAARRFQLCQQGLSWTWDGVRFLVLSPAPEAGNAGPDSDNDRSCVLRIDTGRASMLLPGDIGKSMEGTLRSAGPLEGANLVLAPHHGSRSSSSAPFVSALQPDFVVFSTGYRNRWGFPATEVRQRWQDAGACLLDTAVSGAMVFVTNVNGELQLTRRQRFDGAHLWTADVPRMPACASSGGE